MSTIAISETMEQLHKHCEKYLALHREIIDEGEILAGAIRERYGNVDIGAVLERAEVNSLAAARRRFIADPKKNKWITTSAQGDMFNSVKVKVPSLLMVGGKPKHYYEASILDGLEWWRARQDHTGTEAQRFCEAAELSTAASATAGQEAGKLEELIRKAEANGIDPSTVMYAKEKAEE